MEVNPEVIRANRAVHSAMSAVYESVEPHFRPENKAAVRQKLEALAAKSPSRSRMLDLGCGTGFLISLAQDLFERIDGVDATPEMLAQVRTDFKNVTTHLALVEELPFNDGDFDLVTAYSFLDHLYDYRVMLREAARVMKPGAQLYFDLVPNRHFWDMVSAVAVEPGRPFHQVIEREIDELLNHEQKLEQQFGIKPEDWRLAEPVKANDKGFKPEQILEDLREVGIKAEVKYEWYLGQALVMHGQSFEAADIVNGHLARLLPASRSFFKYLVVYGTKVES
jgi:ubiquinone/menaquinone biosynthesis C-methylase UbiE